MKYFFAAVLVVSYGLGCFSYGWILGRSNLEKKIGRLAGKLKHSSDALDAATKANQK